MSSLDEDFASEHDAVTGTTLYSGRGGSGPAAVVLLHGFPQDCYGWRHMMPALAQRFEVAAVDLRGVDGSAPADDGYDAATMPGDLRHRATRTARTTNGSGGRPSARG